MRRERHSGSRSLGHAEAWWTIFIWRWCARWRAMTWKPWAETIRGRWWDEWTGMNRDKFSLGLVFGFGVLGACGVVPLRAATAVRPAAKRAPARTAPRPIARGNDLASIVSAWR